MWGKILNMSRLYKDNVIDIYFQDEGNSEEKKVSHQSENMTESDCKENMKETGAEKSQNSGTYCAASFHTSTDSIQVNKSLRFIFVLIVIVVDVTNILGILKNSNIPEVFHFHLLKVLYFVF